MKLHTAKRCSARQMCLMLAIVSVGACFVPSTAQASCGDYLANSSDMGGGHLGYTSSSDRLQDGQLPTAPQQPANPRSACESGRCQSAPVAPPTDPSRISSHKQSASIVGVTEPSSHRDDARWAQPADWGFPVSPFLEVASPPPRHS